jgi:hypothetical protein
MRQSCAMALVTEEPDELIAHVRVCGGTGWVTAGSTRNGIENIGKCIRYMDDMVFIIQKNEDPEEMRKQIDQELQKRGLKVKESKTRVTDMADGFDFLGFNFKLIGKPANELPRSKLRGIKIKIV